MNWTEHFWKIIIALVIICVAYSLVRWTLKKIFSSLFLSVSFILILLSLAGVGKFSEIPPSPITPQQFNRY